MMQLYAIIIIVVCILGKTYGLIINKILIQKIINSRIPVENVIRKNTTKGIDKKSIDEAKVDMFKENIRRGYSRYAKESNTDDKYQASYKLNPDEIVMDFRTMFSGNTDSLKNPLP
jgi:hypothetical protein